MRLARGCSLAALAVIVAGSACGEAMREPVSPPGPVASVSSVARVDAGPIDAAADARAASPRQPFVVSIVVDQLSSWALASRVSELPSSGGFARLLREGTYVKELRYAYAVTDTAPGHAALHTGKVPAESGIFGNEVPDKAGKRVSILRDESTRLVGADGELPAPGSSARRLQAPTVADQLRASRPDALVVSISLKDRGAIMPAGKAPTWAVWFDSASDRFVTSTAFAKTFPRWAVPHADAKKAREAAWTLLDPAWVASHAKTPDAQPGEGDLDGLGTTFPHVAKTAPAFRALPASDEVILSLARAAIDAEHDPSRPTLLLLSLSSNDVVGHVFGPDSWEAWDHLRRLDAALGRFLGDLEAKVGPVTVMLSADHGSVSLPEADAARKALPCATRSADRWARPCTGGERISPDLLRDELRAAASKALGPGEWIAGVADPYVFLTPGARALDAAKQKALDATVRGVLARHPGVAQVFDVASQKDRCGAALGSARPATERAQKDEDVFVLVCRSLTPEGDYYVVTKPGSFFDAEIVRGKGSSHGTPYLYDRTVPLLLRARGEVDEGVVVDGAVDFTAFAALQARLVGLDPRPAREILKAYGAAK